VDTLSGSNATPGTASGSGAWKNTEYAVKMLSAGDTLNISAPSILPDRGNVTTVTSGSAGSPITIQGLSATNRAYFIGGKNVSHGATIGNLIKNGEAEGWLSSSSLWGITSGAGNPYARESSVVHGGLAAINCNRTSTTMYLTWTASNLPPSTEFTFSFWHRETAASYRFKYEIKETDPATDNVLQSDGTTWGTTANTFDPNDNSNGAWKQVTRTFTTNAAGTYTFTINLAYTTLSYLDDISLVPTINTYQWAVHSGATYKLTGYTGTVGAVGKSTASAWDASGAEALQFVPKAEDLSTCIATPGTWWYASGVLYYHTMDGEAISDLHIEAATQQNSVVDTIKISHDYYNLKHINAYLANEHVFYSTANNHVNYDYTMAWGGALCNYYFEGITTANDVVSSYTGEEDGFEVAAGTTVVNRGYADYSNDDGFFAIGTGSLTCNYCVAPNNGLELSSNNSGFGVESATASMYLNNVTSINNYGRGIQAGAANVCSIKNSISYGSVVDADLWLNPGTQTIFTHNNNIGGSKNSSWALDATEILSNPLFSSAYRLLPSSPAINAGVASADVTYSSSTGLSLKDPDGIPYHRYAPSIGAYSYLKPLTAIQGGTIESPSLLPNGGTGDYTWTIDGSPSYLSVTGTYPNFSLTSSGLPLDPKSTVIKATDKNTGETVQVRFGDVPQAKKSFWRW
jgi:hypothetical protein